MNTTADILFSLQFLLLSADGGAASKGSVVELYVAGLLFIVAAVFLFYLVKKRKAKFLREVNTLEENIKALKEQGLELKKQEEKLLEEKVKEMKVQIEDMTLNYKALQDSLKRVREDSLRNSMLLSNLGSSIRTNLNGIIGFSILLENEFALNEEDELFEYTRDIKASGESLMYLLNNIIDINRIEANTLDLKETVCDLHRLLEEVTADYKAQLEEKKIKLVVLDEGIPAFLADTEALKHVLINLLDNAVKFTEKGYIKITATYNTDSESVEIRIKDTGIGIDKAYLPDLFEPYRQYSLGYSKKNYQGKGLGLPLVKKLVDKMNGAIEIESEKMAGTTVTVTIPFKKSAGLNKSEPQDRKAKTAQTQQTTETAPGLIKDNLKVLIVDREKLDGMLLKKMLEGYGEVVVTASSTEALQKVDLLVRQQKQPDLIIVETKMNALKGGNLTLLNALKRKLKAPEETFFIALSSFPQPGEEEKMYRQGFNGYMVKPVIKKDLIKVINNVFVNRQIS